MARRPRSPWQDVPPRIRSSIAAAWGYGVPVEATALYGRWWELETWLRSLVYVELRARDGVRWADALSPTAAKRELKDRRHSYMATPDAQTRLAYLDVFDLLDLLDRNWDIFKDSLIERDVWSGRVLELRKIRNRIGHCRRPHADDLGRVEQTLRDLEPGAFRAIAAFNRQYEARDLDDPLAEAWVRRAHGDAARLVDHANRQYEVRFVLRYSRRPWTTRTGPSEPISGRKGYLWHACWFLAGGYFDILPFWKDSYLNPRREMFVYACANAPVSLEVSFAAIDDPDAIADAIGNCFDALLINHHHGPVPEGLWEDWATRHTDLDPRVQVLTTWSIIDDSTVPVTIFGA